MLLVASFGHQTSTDTAVMIFWVKQPYFLLSPCTRYFITSLTDVQEFASSVRKHWSIENQLHWCLDVVFREDAARNRKGSSPRNMNVLRKVALSLVTQAQYGRVSKKKMMFKAALSPNFLLRILFGGKK